jgi:hypothetical protein
MPRKSRCVLALPWGASAGGAVGFLPLPHWPLAALAAASHCRLSGLALRKMCVCVCLLLLLLLLLLLRCCCLC